MPDRTVWINGQLVDEREVTVPLLAQSLQRGTLVFDVYAVLHVGPDISRGASGASCPVGFGAREHTERFVRSARLMDYPLEYGVDDLLQAAGAVVRANPGCDSVRLNVYWREPSLDLLPGSGGPTVVVMAYAVSDFGLVARPSRPARVHVPGMRKVPGAVLPVQAKVAASYAAASVAKRRAKQAGYDDVLLLDGNGHVAESGTMSCFFVLGGRLLVPALDDVLDGITRRAVLEIAADEGVATTIGPVPLEVLAEAEEVFLTSTSRNIWPVGVLTERELPAPGPVTERLAERLTVMLDGADPLSARWLQPL